MLASRVRRLPSESPLFPQMPGQGKGPKEPARGRERSGGVALRPHAIDTAPHVPVGRRVVVHSLTAKRELNGRIGSVVAFDEAKQRYRVCLDESAGAPGVTMAFKPSNMQELN